MLTTIRARLGAISVGFLLLVAGSIAVASLTTKLFFLAAAVGLLMAGYVLTRRIVVSPLSVLDASARRIESGDLESRIESPPGAADEIRAIARSLEDMRRKLATTQQAQQDWVAELERRATRRAQQLAALFAVSTEISRELDIERVLQLVVDKTRDLAGGDVVVLCLLTSSGEGLTVEATSGTEEAFVDHPQSALGAFTPEAIAQTVEAVLRHEGCLCPLLRARFRRSHLAVPLRIGDRVLGMLCVGHRNESHFGEEQIRLLNLLASAGAVALENARAYERAEQMATLAERERILAEIHDGLAQTLSFLELRLDVVERLIEGQELESVPEHLSLTRRTVRQAGQEARRLMMGLRASTASNRTLQELLIEAVTEFARDRELNVESQIAVGQPIEVQPQVYEQVVRVVLEALTNVHKHASSARVTFSLEREGDHVITRIEDDGPGFETHALSGRQGHFGLKVMQARAERIDGELIVDSRQGQGTTVTLRWPLLGVQEGDSNDCAYESASGR